MTHKLHDPSRPLGPDNPPMGYRLAEVGEVCIAGYQWWDSDDPEWCPGDSHGAIVGGDVAGSGPGCPIAFPAETPILQARPNAASLVGIAGDNRDQPLYQSILDQIDAHDSATRGERADRVYAEAMRMIGGG
jgi:hypothetical protein